MKNNFIPMNPRQSTINHRLVTQKRRRRRIAITILSAAFLSIMLAAQLAFAGLQQVFLDGQSGKFKQAHSELQRLSVNLEAQLTSPDIMIVGRNCAAIGFYSMLSQVASDCISKKIDPECGMKLFTAAQKAASGQLDEAALLAKEVADANPKYPQTHLILGRVRMGNYMQLGRDFDVAISTYRHALSIDKGLTVAYLDLGMLYKHKGENDKAVDAYKSILLHSKVPSETKWAHLMLALIYVEGREWLTARKYALEAKRLGFVGMASGTLNQIEQHLPNTPPSQVDQSSPSSLTPKQLYDRAIDAGKNGDFSTSTELLAKAKAVEPVKMPISIALQLARQAKEAKITKEAGVAVFRSISLGNQGKWNESLSEAKRACNLSQDAAPLFVHLGTVYVALIQGGKGDHYARDAIKAYKRAIELDPENGLAYYNLGLAQATSREWTTARENLLKAKSLGVPVPSDVLSEVERRVPSQPKKGNIQPHLGAKAAPESQKGFFDGLLAILELIPIAFEALVSFFKPGGEGIISVRLEALWNAGGGRYKAGFIFGILIIISLLSGGGTAAQRGQWPQRGKTKQEEGGTLTELSGLRTDALLKLLKSEDAGTRRSAISALGEREEPDVVPYLLVMLEDDDEFVRVYATRALAKVGDAGVIEQLRKVKDSANPDVQFHFDEAISQIIERNLVAIPLEIQREQAKIIIYLAGPGEGQVYRPQDSIVQSLTEGVKEVILDLTGLDQVDSEAIKQIFTATVMVRNAGADLFVTNASTMIARELKEAGLDQQILTTG